MNLSQFTILSQKRSRVIFASLIFIFICLYLFLRFYQLDQRITFAWDQERDAYQVASVISEFDITLIGPRVLGPEGFFLGPYFTYLLVPFYAVTNLHPNAILVALFTYNTVFLAIGFYLLPRMFGWIRASMFLALFGLNSLMIVYDTISWNPVLVPLGIVLSWFFLWKIDENPERKINWLVLGTIIGLWVHFHMQFIFVIIFAGAFLLSRFRKTLFTTYVKQLMLVITPFFVFLFPLFLFDLRNNFLNSSLAYNFFVSGAGGEKDIVVWFDVLGNVFQTVFIRSDPFIGLIAISAIFIMSISMYRLSSRSFLQHFGLANAVMVVATIIAFIAYGKRPSEYYFVFLLPFFYILLLHFFDFGARRIKIIALGCIFVFLTGFNVMNAYENTMKTNQLSLHYRDSLAQYLSQTYDTNDFYVSKSTPIGQDAGFNYILEYYGISLIPIEGSGDRSLVEINIPADQSDYQINPQLGLKIPKNLQEK